MWKKIKELWKKYRLKLLALVKNLKLKGFVFLVAFLGAYAGSHGTSLLWRRAGIAGLTFLYALTALAPTVGWQALWTITIMSMWGGLSIGYGIPDDGWPQNPNLDSGSTVGRFWTMLFRKLTNNNISLSHRLGDYFTRGTVGLTMSLSMLSVPILKGNWLVYGLGTLGIITAQALVSWRGWGSFKQKIFGKEVEFLWSDLANYTIIGFCIYAMITFKILG